MADEPNVSAEMDPGSDAVKQMLAGIKPSVEKVEKSEVKPKGETDVKSTPESSSDKETPDAKQDVPVEDESPEALKAKIKGLEAEVGRRKGQHSKVEQLETEIAQMREDLKKREPVDDSPDAKLKAAILKLDEDGLIEKQVEWQEEQVDARTALRLAERDGDTKAQQEATQRIVNARKVLKALEVGRTALSQRKQSSETSEKEFVKSLESEVESIVKDAYELYPDIKDPNSALFKAGDAEFRKRPHLTKAMGQTMGELVSLAYAILRNPALVQKAGETGKPAEKVRKDLLSNLDEATSKAFLKGGGAPTTKTTPNYAESVETPDGLAGFEKLVAKAKGG